MTKTDIYKFLIQKIDDGEMFCMCPSLAMYTGGGFVLSRDFPEVHGQQPEGYTPLSGPWFPVNAKGMQRRREVLINALNQL